MGFIICIRRISRYMKRKFTREFRNRKSRIWVSRRIFAGIKKGV